MILLLLMAYNIPKEPECVIDRCEDKVCIVETPEGFVDIPKKHDYHDGKKVVCPLWLIDPT